MRNLPTNVSFSSISFEADIIPAKWAIYRGSTAIVSALAGGIRPIYIQKPGEIEIDPLHRLHTWKQTISGKDELEDVFTNPNIESCDNDNALKEAQNFARRFYKPYDHKVITGLLQPGNN